ncbi:hypothetical protein [Megasphaera elsdenii]|uniref:hypothetical protein n=1 Tax=Megasphaera elsdenii TaxID=907 RepID=UPI003FF05B11
MNHLDKELYKLRPRVPRRPSFRGGKTRRARQAHLEPEPVKQVKPGSLADDIREANRLKIDYGIYMARKMGLM